jgi:hypothetical protein
LNPHQDTKEPNGAAPLDATVRLSPWQEQNKWKHSNISFLSSSKTDAVLRAAIDYKNFQSLENGHALYIATLDLLGEKPDIPFELD